MTVETYRPNGGSVREKLEHGKDEFQQVRSEFSGIADDMRVLAEKEVELLRAEMGEQFGHATRVLLWGGITALAGLVLLTFAFVSIMLALDLLMPLWAAALVTTGIALAVVATAALMARAQVKQVTVVPKRTMNSVKEDVSWARKQLTSSAR